MTFTERMIGAAKLDTRVYEEVEADRHATKQAFAVIAMATLAEIIGGTRLGPSFLVPILLGALIGWLIWGFLIYVVGVYLLPEPQTNANIGELLRTVGFAASPGVLNIFAIIPLLGAVVRFVVWIWLIMATVLAVRQALDYQSTGRAVAVCLIASLVGFVVRLILAVTFVGMTFLTARSLIF
jgi:hypothetical protein